MLRPQRVPDQDPDRRRVEAVAGIVDLRAIGDDAEHVHLGDQLDIVAGLAETPSTMVISPVGSIGTFMKKLMLGTMSRLLMPCFVTSSTKLSRQACRYFVSWPKRTVLLSQEQAPAEVSCRPQVSAVTVSMTLPSLDMILVPVPT